MPQPRPRMSQATAPNRAEAVYRELRRLLMDGSLAPWDRLAEEPLADQFDVSRTPVREALKRLQSDGLVQRRPGGLFPYVPRFDDLADLYEARIMLECHGLNRCTSPATPHDRERLGVECRRWRGWIDDLPALDAGFVSRDEQFHMELLASSGNEVLVEMLQLINQRIRPVRMYDYLTPERMHATVSEHVAIATHVLDGDLEGAERALVAHITASRDVVIERASHSLAAISTEQSGEGIIS